MSVRERGLRSQTHYVGGGFTRSVGGGEFTTLNPATNEVIASVADGREADVRAAVSAARDAFDRGSWPRMGARERAAVLRRAAELIRRRADDLVELECLDIGMPISQMNGLARRAAANFDYFAGVIEELAGTAWRDDGFLNYSVYKPVGVAGLIMPWNAPLMLSTWRIAPCLAAGNTIVLKPAEWAPLSATPLAEILAEAGVPPGAFNVVHGFGETAGAALSRDPGVNLIAFTGEPATGETIMAAAAPTLKRCSFELGGKSAVVVFDDAADDLEPLIDSVLFQIFSMNGQRCTAGSRLLVHEDLYDRLLAAVVERARHLRVGDPFDADTELGPLIRPEHHDRVLGLIRSARDDGASVLAGGERPERLPGGNYLEPTVIGDVAPGMRAFDEEIFGPVLVATSFSDEDEAIRLANATPYGLAAYVWTGDLRRAHRVAEAMDVGMCWVNSHNVRDLRTPFGGSKRSGIGREGGTHSFEFYCERETIQVALGGVSVPRFGVA